MTHLPRGEGAAAAESVFLSDRERQSVTLLVKGFKDDEIAATMSVDLQTVKRCFRDIQRKVGASDRLELVLSVVHRKMLSAPPVIIQTGSSTRKDRRPAA